MLELVWGAVTDPGRRRPRNEDAFIAQPPIFAVADGMGGHTRGDVASALAIEGMHAVSSDRVSRAALLDAVRRAHDAISSASVDGDPHGMGTTLCGLAATSEGDGQSLLVFNVGDSRAYRLERGTLTQLTTDHSVVEELIASGAITADEGSTHPERHVITRSLGGGGVLQVDWWTVEPRHGDRYLLCSDGLSKELSTEEISATLIDRANPQSAAEGLLAQALDAGGRDNITVIVIDITALDSPGPAAVLDADTNPRRPGDGPTLERLPSLPSAPTQLGTVIPTDDAPSHGSPL